jgi:hypothetical protein
MPYLESGKEGQGEGLEQGERGRWSERGLKRKKRGKMYDRLTNARALIESSTYKVPERLIKNDLLIILLPSSLCPYCTALTLPLGLLAHPGSCEIALILQFLVGKYFKDK